MNGWYLEPLAGGQKGTRVVYLNEIDLNGWIPEAILKMVALQIPMAVADVRKYLTRHGSPAFITRSGYTVRSSIAIGQCTAADHEQGRCLCARVCR